MFDRNPSQSEIRSAMQSLQALGVASVKVHFSGGNDEGGADDVQYLDAAGNKVTGIPAGNAYENRYWQNGREHNDGWFVYDRSLSDDYREQKRPATAEEIAASKRARVIESPIYAEYGSFAGEFYVDGTLTWDVASGKYEMHGQQEVSHWEEF